MTSEGVPFPFVSVLDVALARGAHEVEGRINGGEFARLGLPMLSGCQHCGATLGPYNAYPTQTGYIQCADCLEGSDLGFISIAAFEAFDATS